MTQIASATATICINNDTCPPLPPCNTADPITDNIAGTITGDIADCEIPDHRKELDHVLLSPVNQSPAFDLELLLHQLMELLEHWVPSPSSTIMQELEELAKLFQHACSHTAKPLLPEEMASFVRHSSPPLTAAITRLIKTHLPELYSFIRVYAPPTAMENLTSSLASFITGAPMTVGTPAHQRLPEQGVYYKKPAHHTGTLYTTTSFTKKTEPNPLLFEKSGSHIPAKCIQEKKQPFCLEFPKLNKPLTRQVLHHLERTERLISHLNQGGALYTLPAFSADNDEFLGFAMAYNSLKIHIFSTCTRLPAPIASPLQKAVENLIDHFIRDAAPKEVYRIHYNTMKYYQTSNSPKDALEQGLTSALEQFYSKKEDSESSVNPRYQKESGFFQAKEGNGPTPSILASNIRLLKKDWQLFLNIIGRTQDSNLNKVFSHYSPWAALLIPVALPVQASTLSSTLWKALLFTALFIILFFILFF